MIEVGGHEADKKNTQKREGSGRDHLLPRLR
jgi:hypothetical protein